MDKQTQIADIAQRRFDDLYEQYCAWRDEQFDDEEAMDVVDSVFVPLLNQLTSMIHLLSK